MSYSINTTPLLQEYDSDIENDDSTNVETNGPNLQDVAQPLFKPYEPKDRYYMAYIIFYLLGVVTLLPWNFFVTADDYWLYKFRDTHANASLWNTLKKRTPLQAEFTSYISVASAVPGLIFLALNTALSHRISLNIRVIGSLIAMLILFLITLIFVNIDTDNWQNGFFLLTIISIVLLNVCSAILSGSIYGVIGRFDPHYITATVGGQALGGIFAALAEITSLAIGASSVHSAFVYFIIGSLTIILSIICYIILSRTVFFKFHLYKKHLNSNDMGNEIVSTSTSISVKTVSKKIYTYGFAMFTVFLFTLAVCPGVTVLIESEGKGQGKRWNDVYFVPTINYLLFSVGDYLGRLLAGSIQKPKTAYVQLIFSLSRFIFIPLLMLCNAQPRKHWDVVFDKDYQYILILFICSLTNGYLANLISICVPKFVDAEEKELASSIVTVFMGFGLALGSAISLIIVKVL